jgi:hypothetical protein
MVLIYQRTLHAQTRFINHFTEGCDSLLVWRNLYLSQAMEYSLQCSTVLLSTCITLTANTKPHVAVQLLDQVKANAGTGLTMQQHAHHRTQTQYRPIQRSITVRDSQGPGSEA